MAGDGVTKLYRYGTLPWRRKRMERPDFARQAPAKEWPGFARQLRQTKRLDFAGTGAGGQIRRRTE